MSSLITDPPAVRSEVEVMSPGDSVTFLQQVDAMQMQELGATLLRTIRFSRSDFAFDQAEFHRRRIRPLPKPLRAIVEPFQEEIIPDSSPITMLRVRRFNAHSWGYGVHTDKREYEKRLVIVVDGEGEWRTAGKPYRIAATSRTAVTIGDFAALDNSCEPEARTRHNLSTRSNITAVVLGWGVPFQQRS